MIKRNKMKTKNKMKTGKYITLQIYPLIENGELKWMLSDSEWDRNRITSDYDPMQNQKLKKRFKSYMKFALLDMIGEKVSVEDGIKKSVNELEKMVLKKFRGKNAKR